jgi:hypothetical protein
MRPGMRFRLPKAAILNSQSETRWRISGQSCVGRFAVYENFLVRAARAWEPFGTRCRILLAEGFIGGNCR